MESLLTERESARVLPGEPNTFSEFACHAHNDEDQRKAVLGGEFETITPEAAGNANTDDLFRYDSAIQAYVYNVSLAG
jgi:hypothetical protein